MFNQEIHTTLPLDDIKKLKMYGNGKIKNGIKKLIEIAESKDITVTVITNFTI